MVKIHFDAIVIGKQMCFELVARDVDGFVLGGRIGVLNKEMHIEWAKMQALDEIIKFA